MYLPQSTGTDSKRLLSRCRDGTGQPGQAAAKRHQVWEHIAGLEDMRKVEAVLVRKAKESVS